MQSYEALQSFTWPGPFLDPLHPRLLMSSMSLVCFLPTSPWSLLNTFHACTPLQINARSVNRLSVLLRDKCKYLPVAAPRLLPFTHSVLRVRAVIHKLCQLHHSQSRTQADAFSKGPPTCMFLGDFCQALVLMLPHDIRHWRLPARMVFSEVAAVAMNFTLLVRPRYSGKPL